MSAPTVSGNALDAVLASARRAQRLALLAYLTAGFPDAASTRRWGPLLAESGADLIEMGVPFSDPLGDGPTIQASSQRALEGGMTLRGSLDVAVDIGQRCSAPIVLMSYCNPIFRMGIDTFTERAAAAGVSALIAPDLPIEEAGELARSLATRSIHLAYLLSPASTVARLEETARRATGFIYCMAVTGVTGERKDLAEGLPDFLARVRALTDVPLVVGFGISRPEHLRALRGQADGAVVASALVRLIDRTSPGERDAALGTFVKELHAACSAS